MSEEIIKTLDLFFEDQIEQKSVLDWGVKKIERMPHAQNLQEWIHQGYHAKMDFMEKYLSQRLDPTKIVEWARSVLMFTMPYPVQLSSPLEKNGDFRIARYAMGKDYHYRSSAIVIELEKKLKQRHPQLKLFSFSDSKPIFERDWASEIGLGWRGKNSCTIHPERGSGFLLGGLLLNEDLEKIKIVEDYCGSCRRCIDVCPTQAFIQEGVLDSNRCISYWTIEEKGDIPMELSSSFGQWIFGCDLCQEVCPWNQKYLKKMSKSNVPNSFNLSLNQWISTLKKGGGFQKKFKGTPLLRAGRRKLLRNLMIAIRNLSLKPKIQESLKELEKEEEDWVKVEILKTINFLNDG